jgi:tetratricopeptide (TPR) repeat protein
MAEEPNRTMPAAPDGSRVSGSGIVASGSVTLIGKYVAGRDLIINQSFERPFEIAAGVFQLPPDISDFTGREDAVETLTAWLGDAADTARTVVLAGISGMGGVGKTALAIHLAHRLSPKFPDGQLYVNLRGGEAEQVAPGDVLTGFLRALGVQVTAIPDRVDERSSLYRGLLSSRKVLVVLDNAVSEAQVRPLLPGARTCAVLVTSRSRLVGLEGARAYDLRVMSPPAALDLFEKVLGDERAAAEPDAAAEIVRLCGYLPLAVRITAARLAARPNWRLARMLPRLAREHQRLAELEAGDLSVRASFALSYDALDEADRTAFRLLGLVRAPEFPAWVLAALIDSGLATADDVLDRLTGLQLVENIGEDSAGQLRFRFHDLLRSFARERLEAEGPPAGDPLERLLGAYLAVSKRALYLMSPNSKRDSEASRARAWLPPDIDADAVLPPDPIEWFSEAEAGIVAAVGQAHEAGLWNMTWELADPLHYHFRVLARWADWVASHELALEAAQRAGNRRGEAIILRNLGNAHRDQGQLVQAISCYESGLDIAAELKSTLLQAFMLNGLGEVNLDRGRMAEAGAYFQRSLPAWAAVDDLTGVAYTHTHLALVHLQADRVADAMTHAQRSLAMQQEFRDLSGQGYALSAIGDIHRWRGEWAQAKASYERFLSVARDRGLRLAEADMTVKLGWLSRAQGQLDAAATAFGDALAVYLEYGKRHGEAEAVAGLGAVFSDQGDTGAATVRLDRAHDLATTLDDVLLQARVLALLADAAAAAGDTERSDALRGSALVKFGEAGSAEGGRLRS